MTDEPQGDHRDDVAFIEALAQLLKAHDLAELEVRREFAKSDGLSVRLSRTGATPAPVSPQPAVEPAPAATAMPEAPMAPAAQDPAAHPGAVTSPMVGTAYLQPEPGATPFVSVGDAVAEGQTLLIVEAMKTMNQIPAPHAGKVTRILIEDGAPVEFGAPLMIVE